MGCSTAPFQPPFAGIITWINPESTVTISNLSWCALERMYLDPAGDRNRHHYESTKDEKIEVSAGDKGLNRITSLPFPLRARVHKTRTCAHVC